MAEASRENDALEFVMSHVGASDRYKQQYLPRWQEALSNFFVEPYDDQNANSVNRPYGKHQSRLFGYNNGSRIYSSPHRNIQLKDPETHKAVMTFAAKLVKALLGDKKREYVSASPVGWEDAPLKAPTTTRLLRYAFGLPGSFRTMVEAIIDMLIFGTGIIEVQWRYEDVEMPVRTVEFDPLTGVEESFETRQRVTAYDDVELTVIDPADFYPDPGEYRMDRMKGAAKKFRMTALKARYLASSGRYDKSAVERAIGSSVERNKHAESTGNHAPDDDWREGVDQPQDRESVNEFREMIGYEYSGEVPWADDLGSSRRIITVLNGVVVRDRPYPLADPTLPFKTLIINPVNGRFYGVSPAEVIRHDQDFTDAMKILLATAVVRKVHAPLAYDSDSDLDVAMLRRWKPDQPIPIRGGPNNVGAIRYDVNTMDSFNMTAMLKNSMQEASGALGGIQGEEGPDREAATVGALRMQNAMNRPELAAMVIENECLPPIAASILRRYQQFLPDTPALMQRVGELPESAWIGDIMGDFDIQFVGSRMSFSRQQKLQAVDRIIALASVVPQAMAGINWEEFLKNVIGDTMELPDVAAFMADPQMMMRNIMMARVMGGIGASNGNGQAQGSEPAGALPAQMGGATVEQ